MLKKISEFEVGEDIQGFYLVRESQLRLTNAGKRYLDTTLIDATGEINAKYWDAEEFLIGVFEEGKIVKISAKVNEWQNKKQLSIKKYRPLSPNDEVEIENFVPSAPEKGDVLFAAVLEKVHAMTNDDIKEITKAIMLERRESLIVYPAAKSNHHAIRSGLIYHIYRMTEVAEKLTQVYDGVNRDLLIAGVILHDMCKIDEMALSPMGLISEYTIKGNLIGHISMGMELIAQKGRELKIDSEVVMLLQHMILSHHYYPEYGSPKYPLFLEAQLLHYIDNIDATLFDFQKAVKELPKGVFSDPVWSLDKRRIYKPKL